MERFLERLRRADHEEHLHGDVAEWLASIASAEGAPAAASLKSCPSGCPLTPHTGWRHIDQTIDLSVGILREPS